MLPTYTRRLWRPRSAICALAFYDKTSAGDQNDKLPLWNTMRTCTAKALHFDSYKVCNVYSTRVSTKKIWSLSLSTLSQTWAGGRSAWQRCFSFWSQALRKKEWPGHQRHTNRFSSRVYFTVKFIVYALVRAVGRWNRPLICPGRVARPFFFTSSVLALAACSFERGAKVRKWGKRRLMVCVPK